MKSMRNSLVLALVLGSATAASAGMVRRAGEWETSVDGGKPILACAMHDAAFDKESVAKMMARMPRAKCETTGFNTIGPVTTFSMQCDIMGNHMITSGTITQTGPESFSSKAHSHIEGGVMKLPDGKAFPMPDQDISTVSRRTGECKPGDRTMPE